MIFGGFDSEIGKEKYFLVFVCWFFFGPNTVLLEKKI